NQIFIRDLNQAWYQKGLEKGKDKSIVDYIQLLEKQINELNPKKVVFVGNSAGGYAALLFGHLLNADSVYAFAPQTFIDRKNRMKYIDFRWRDKVFNVRMSTKASEFQNLKKVFNSIKNFNTQFHIYYDHTFRLDRIHAKQLKGMKNVTLHSVNDGGHYIVKKLKYEGKLMEILSYMLMI